MKPFRGRLALPLLGLLAILAILSWNQISSVANALAGICTVPGDTYETIQQALASDQCNTVRLIQSHYQETITVDRSVVLEGTGMDVTTVDGGDGGTVITILNNPTVRIAAMTITNGRREGMGGGIFIQSGNVTLEEIDLHGNVATDGGGIGLQSGSLIIRDSVIRDNQTAKGAGGGLYVADGSVTIANSQFVGNETYLGGGGALEIEQGSVNIFYSTLADNLADWGGGLENVGGTVIFSNSLATGNRADYGSGFFNNLEGSLTITNSTVSGNLGGAGIYNDGGQIWIGYSTVAYNTGTGTTGNVAGVYNALTEGTIAITNSLVAYHATGYACGGYPISSLGYNLSSDGSCDFGAASDQEAIDPLLGPLQDNGGPTWTHRLLAGSPAIDQGGRELCPETDQRAVSRPADGNGDGVVACDIGAYELSNDEPQPTPTPNSTVTPDLFYQAQLPVVRRDVLSPVQQP